MKWSQRTAEGKLVVRGEPELVEAVAALALEAQGSAHHVGGRRELGGRGVYFKGTRLRGRAALRHGLRRHCLLRPLPFEREAANLAWLRAHGFGAPLPLAAGGLWGVGLPRYQFLVTEEVAGARTVAAILEGAERGTLLERLGSVVRRLHAAGYVHRDLFARNVLVDAGGGFVFLDTRRGGRPLPGRGAEYDVACFTGDVGPEDGERFLRGYGRPG